MKTKSVDIVSWIVVMMILFMMDVRSARSQGWPKIASPDTTVILLGSPGDTGLIGLGMKTDTTDTDHQLSFTIYRDGIRHTYQFDMIEFKNISALSLARLNMVMNYCQIMSWSFEEHAFEDSLMIELIELVNKELLKDYDLR